MHRCARPECSKLINTNKSFYNIGERHFCSNLCGEEWRKKNDMFETVANPLYERPRKPVNMAGWPQRDYGDENDAKQLDLFQHQAPPK